MKARNVVLSFALLLTVIWFVTSGDWEPLVVALMISVPLFGLDAVDKTRLSIHPNAVSISNPEPITLSHRHLRYSFDREDFVNPKIVQELNGWISDAERLIIAINLTDGNQSNQFHGLIEKTASVNGVEVTVREGREFVSYKLLGISKSGVNVVLFSECGGGSGVFMNVMLLSLSESEEANWMNGAFKKRNRTILQYHGSIPLGDRFGGEVEYSNGELSIVPEMKSMRETIHTNPVSVKIG